MARHDQIIRLLNVANALAASRQGIPLKALAERHRWPLRNVYRDLASLEAAHFNVVECAPGRYRIDNLGPLAPGAPAPDERLALFVARAQNSITCAARASPSPTGGGPIEAGRHCRWWPAGAALSVADRRRPH